MKALIPLSFLLALAPFTAYAAPSMVGKWSCENYDESNAILGVVTYFEDGTSEGSFNLNAVQEGTEISIYGVYRADWAQTPTSLSETITWVDIQVLKVNGQDFSKSPTENEMEQSMVNAGTTHSQIIDSSEVEVVLEDTEGKISKCALL